MGRQARVSLGNYFAFCSAERRHHALGYRIPAEVASDSARPPGSGSDIDPLDRLTCSHPGDEFVFAPDVASVFGFTSGGDASTPYFHRRKRIPVMG